MKTNLQDLDLAHTPVVHLQGSNLEGLLGRLEGVVRSIEDATEVTAAREAYDAAKVRHQKEKDALGAVQGRLNELAKSIRESQERLESELVEHYQSAGSKTETPKPIRDLIDRKSEQSIVSSTITSLVERRIPVAQFAEYRAAGTYARSRAAELTCVAHGHFRRITEGLREIIDAEFVLTIDTSAGFTGLLMAKALEFGLEANMFFKNADEAERKWKAMHADIANKSLRK